MEKELNKSFCFLLVFFFSATSLLSQDLNLTFKFPAVDSKVEKNIWSGGIAAPQFNKAFLNQDNLSDLVIYDNVSKRVTCYVYNNGKYNYEPEFEFLFPEVSHFIKLIDSDNDGDLDLFTLDNNGLIVYKNSSQSNDLIFEDEPALVFTEAFSGILRLQINITDMPIIKDLDEDGDIDVLTPTPYVGGTLTYHQNNSVENYGRTDTLAFQKISDQWGGFVECGGCEKVILRGDTSSCFTNQKILHNGTAITSIDYDNDGDKDVLFSEVGCTSFLGLTNVANNSEPIIGNVRTEYPDSSLTLPFPVAYYEDFDNDGNKDLIVSTLYNGSNNGLINYSSSVCFYHRSSEGEASTKFELLEKGFLQSEMMLFGEEPYPYLCDIDNDEDLDLLVGNYGKVNPSGDFYSTISLFENTRTSEDPEYRLITDDYLSFSEKKWKSIKPQLIDLDKDGKREFVFSYISNDEYDLKIGYFVDNGNSNFNASNVNNLAHNISISRFDYMKFFDIDQDDDQDILVARNSSGRIEWYEKEGDNFLLKEESIGNIGGIREKIKCFDIKRNSKDSHIELITSTSVKQINVYKNYDFAENRFYFSNKAKVEDKTSSRFGELSGVTYTSKSLILGSLGGGLIHLSRSSEITSTEVLKPTGIKVYPNPADNNLKVEFDQIITEFVIYNMLGQIVLNKKKINTSKFLTISTKNWANGFYYLRYNSDRLNNGTLKITISH